MRQRILYPKVNYNQKANKCIGAHVNTGYYNRHYNNSKTLKIDECCKNLQKFHRRRQDKEFNKLLNNYYQDYNKFKNRQKFIPMINKEEKNSFDYNKYQVKKNNLSVLFFAYDIRNNENINFSVTDELIKSMYNGNDENTLIKCTQIRDDYEMRLNGNKKKGKRHKKNEEDEEEKGYRKRKKIDFNEEVSSGDQSSSFKNENESKNKRRVEIKRANRIEEEDVDDEKFSFIENGEKIIDDNYLRMTNIPDDNNISLFKDIINKNYNEEYKLPTYKIPKSVFEEEEDEKKNSEELQNMYKLQNNQTLNKYKDGELKRFKDIIVDNNYPVFEQITNPYFQTDYKPPPCFPKMPEDEEEIENDEYGYGDFGFDEDNKKEIEEDDDELILLSNQINNKEFPMFDHLLRNDFKGNYAPPVYKIPQHIQKSIQKEEDKKREDQEMFEKNRMANVGNDLNQYNDGGLKMLNNIVQDDEFPLFSQLIDPYYQTKYIPPEVYPKPHNLEEKEEEENYGHGDFELIADKEVEGNEDDDLVLISQAVLNNEYPMFDNLIRNDFKGRYAPPIYKIPESMKEKKVNYNEINRKNFEEMRGKFLSPEDMKKNELPTVGQIISDNPGQNGNNEINDESDEYGGEFI